VLIEEVEELTDVIVPARIETVEVHVYYDLVEVVIFLLLRTN